jgi:hypothetical protein
MVLETFKNSMARNCAMFKGQISGKTVDAQLTKPQKISNGAAAIFSFHAKSSSV